MLPWLDFQNKRLIIRISIFLIRNIYVFKGQGGKCVSFVRSFHPSIFYLYIYQIFLICTFILSYNLIYMFFPTYFIIFDHSSYFSLPSDQNNLYGHASSDNLPSHSILVSEKQKSNEKLNIYLDVYRQQIGKMKELSSKKAWTPVQDSYLLKLNEEEVNWQDIAKIFPHTNAAICKRRFYRLKQQLTKWPPQLDSQIRILHENTSLTWPEIRRIINEKFCQSHGIPKFSTNKIKQRYSLYLRPGISKQEWSIDQDIELIKVIKQNGKQWTKVIKANNILQNRTQLQLKNRYFGTLKFLEKKVIRKVTSILKQINKNNSSN